jgi:type II secretion system protein I
MQVHSLRSAVASGGNRSSAGFTLIEVVVATVILASALVAALATYGSELRTLARARETAVAMDLAEDRLAAVELYALDRLPNVPDSLEEGAFGAPFDAYRWETAARTLSGQDLAELTVRVRWSPDGAYELVTVLPLPSLRRTAP